MKNALAANDDQFLFSLDLTIETAYEEIEKLVDGRKEDKGGIVIYSGTHPEHGYIHIIIPAMGTSVLLPGRGIRIDHLLPIAIRDF